VIRGSSLGWDRPKAACPPAGCCAAGEAGGFNAVQKLFTNGESSGRPLAGDQPRTRCLRGAETQWRSGSQLRCIDPASVSGVLRRVHGATGQRIGECLAVLWMEVDVDRGQIQVTAAPAARMRWQLVCRSCEWSPVSIQWHFVAHVSGLA
jgi:hypothetical protein